MKAANSPGEEMFAIHVRADNLPTPDREYRFCPPRRWRFDFAWPAYRVAVEIEGGTRGNGRHNRHAGFEADCEKYNVATIEGWRVFRFTTQMVKSGTAIEQMRTVFSRLNEGMTNE